MRILTCKHVHAYMDIVWGIRGGHSSACLSNLFPIISYIIEKGCRDRPWDNRQQPDCILSMTLRVRRVLLNQFHLLHVGFFYRDLA